MLRTKKQQAPVQTLQVTQAAIEHSVLKMLQKTHVPRLSLQVNGDFLISLKYKDGETLAANISLWGSSPLTHLIFVTTLAATERRSVTVCMPLARGRPIVIASRATFGFLYLRAITPSVTVVLPARTLPLPLVRSLPVASGVRLTAVQSLQAQGGQAERL